MIDLGKGTYPNLSVQIPIIPHRGIKIVTTLVTVNYVSFVSIFVMQRPGDYSEFTILLVLIFQYFWIYQKPSVLGRNKINCETFVNRTTHLIVEVIAWDRPRYV